MGFIEEEVKRLSASVEKLESRIRSMEERAFGGASKQSEEIRMILIGPPGAGAFYSNSLPVEEEAFAIRTVWLIGASLRRQGHASSQDQGKVLVLPSGESIGVANPRTPPGSGR